MYSHDKISFEHTNFHTHSLHTSNIWTYTTRSYKYKSRARRRAWIEVAIQSWRALSSRSGPILNRLRLSSLRQDESNPRNALYYVISLEDPVTERGIRAQVWWKWKTKSNQTPMRSWRTRWDGGRGRVKPKSLKTTRKIIEFRRPIP